MLNKLLRILFIGFSVVLISGCGLKGPLEHPKSAQIDQQLISPDNLVQTNLT